jgi:hypothetical protein
MIRDLYGLWLPVVRGFKDLQNAVGSDGVCQICLVRLGHVGSGRIVVRLGWDWSGEARSDLIRSDLIRSVQLKSQDAS